MFTELYNDLLTYREKLSLVGFGYVGMPIAVAFARKINVIGFDFNKEKIKLYKIPQGEHKVSRMKRLLMEAADYIGDVGVDLLSSYLQGLLKI